MVPKVDTLSPIYLIPGGIVLIGLSFPTAIFIHCSGLVVGTQGLPSSNATVAVLFAILCVVGYVVGYAIWAHVGGVYFFSSRSKKDNLHVTAEMLSYISYNEPLRKAYDFAFRTRGYAAESRILDDLPVVFCDSKLSDAKKRKKASEIVESHLGSDATRHKLVVLVWDAVYERNNANFIGRMISSWNNYKFAAATEHANVLSALFSLIAVLWAGYFWRYESPIDEFCRRACIMSLYWFGLVMLLYAAYRWAVRPWRRRVFARDLVCGLRAENFGGIYFDDRKSRR